MSKRVAVILSGSGVYDGAELHESVLCLLALDRVGAEIDDRARCRSTGVGVRGNRKDQLGPFFLRNVDIGRDGIVRARVNTVRLITARRAIGRADAAEVGDRGRYR